MMAYTVELNYLSILIVILLKKKKILCAKTKVRQTEEFCSIERYELKGKAAIQSRIIKQS